MRILVVDDSKAVSTIIAGILEKEGHSITICNDGIEAINILVDSEEKFDLVFLDIVMPEVSGYQVVKALESFEEYEKVPIVALTSNSKSDDIMKCYSVGFDYYIAKPTTKNQLLYAIDTFTEE